MARVTMGDDRQASVCPSGGASMLDSTDDVRGGAPPFVAGRPDDESLGGAVRFGLTVLVPAYNEAGSIADTIRSLQAQTVPIDEIVVVDDCSTDDTARIARGFGV